MKVNKCNAIVAALVISAMSLTGCQWLKDHWRAVITVIIEIGQIISKITACNGSQCTHGGAGEKVVIAPPNYRPNPTFWTGLVRAVDIGRAVEGAGECTLACTPPFGDPASLDCDDCRTAVGISETRPFFNLCVGRAYVLPAERVLGTVTAFTDRGAYGSQLMFATRRLASVRYDDCGSPTRADYDLDQAESNRFASYVRDRGARELYRLEWQQVPSGAPDDAPLIALAPEIKQSILDGTFADLDGADTVVRTSAFPFQAGGADPALGPGQFDGAIMTSGAGASYDELLELAQGGTLVISGPGRGGFKPCSSDADCTPWNLVCRPSDVGLVCLAP